MEANTEQEPTLTHEYPASQVLTCPECGSAMVLRMSRRYSRPFYGCTSFPACRSTHGAHPDGAPLGIPADKETKEWRVKAHTVFDPVWGRDDDKLSQEEKKRRRYTSYRWLAVMLGITDAKRHCHIARFNIEQCQKVIEICEGVTFRQVEIWYRGHQATKRHKQNQKRRRRDRRGRR